MIEKTWVEPEDFVPALKFALEHFRCEKIDWDKTLAALQADAYEEIVTKEAERRLRTLDKSSVTSGEQAQRRIQEINLNCSEGRVISCGRRIGTPREL
jgi:hypothetical protein